MHADTKYLVIETDDIESNLTTGERLLFRDLVRKIELGREDAGKVDEKYMVMKVSMSYFPEIMRSMQQESG